MRQATAELAAGDVEALLNGADKETLRGKREGAKPGCQPAVVIELLYFFSPLLRGEQP